MRYSDLIQVQLDLKNKKQLVESLRNFDQYSDLAKISISVKQTVKELDDQLLSVYYSYLELLAEKLGMLYQQGKTIFVNVITDYLEFLQNQSELKVDKNYIKCQLCPCYVCKREEEIFLADTGDVYTPPVRYCKKNLIELATAIKYAREVGIEATFSYLSYEDVEYLAVLSGGSTLLKNLHLERGIQDEVSRV